MPSDPALLYLRENRDAKKKKKKKKSKKDRDSVQLSSYATSQFLPFHFLRGKEREIERGIGG
jgi:hypothetical protein